MVILKEFKFPLVNIPKNIAEAVKKKDSQNLLIIKIRVAETSLCWVIAGTPLRKM